jgi:HK97 family phage major capsid protein
LYFSQFYPIGERWYATTFYAGNKAIAFGDMSYYWIAGRQGRTFQRLNELYAMKGQVGVRGYERVDGKLILPEVIKTLAIK